MRTRATSVATVLAMALSIGFVPGARADDLPDGTIEQTPPRLSLTDGQVSFWRPGAQDWTQAQINTPLAPGDALATGSPGTLEVQIGARAFVRAWGNTQLSLASHEPDVIQFTLTAGSAVFDLRTLESGRRVEVSTSNAALTIEQAGYYRVDVAGERFRVMTRRGGRATVTAASGQTVTVTPSEEVVIEGTASLQLAAHAPVPLDEWDRWNDARTDQLLDAVSARYVATGTYGLSDLDPHGAWQVVPTYGTVWVPTGVPAGWTPYSTGSWILDPVYGWTWVDTAPWGWAPYHHGRWCFVNGYWAWAPGPVIQRPVYAPALVAFLDEPRQGAVIGPGGPPVGWVPLGWGEPVVPWWGRWRARREPSWRGWGGPRVVNNVVIHHTTVVRAHHITRYRNASVPHAVVAVDRTRFGHGPTGAARVFHVDAQRMKPIHGAPRISATPASFAPTAVRGVRPPDERLKRPVVDTRPMPREAPRSVTASRAQKQETDGEPSRRPFGRGTLERRMKDGHPSPAAPPPNGTSVAPLRPRSVDGPSPTGMRSPGSPDRLRPTLQREPTSRRAGSDPRGAPLTSGSTGVPQTLQPGRQIVTPPGQVRTAPELRPAASGAPVASGYTASPSGRAVNRPETSRQPVQPLPGAGVHRPAPGRLQKGPASPAGSKS